jgi:prephenate dehydrogenase
MRVAFLGFGLIAGSIARALSRSLPDGPFVNATLVAWSPGGEGPRAAVRDGVIADAPADPAPAVADADLVILAGPPLACLDLIDRLGGDLGSALKSSAVVSDVASTKAAIVERAGRHGLRFVGGHPMAGREQTGYAAGTPELFRDRPWVVVPAAGTDPEPTELVEDLARACGARPMRMGAAEHDSAVAAISHLPLILAAALVEAVATSGRPDERDWDVARSLAASGWRDMTRLARGDPEMGAGIVSTNANALLQRLRDFHGVLGEWLEEVERVAAGGNEGAEDLSTIRRRFEAARERLGDEP